MVIKRLNRLFPLGRAAALRTAQLKLMGEPVTSHPSFWALFVLVGDGGTP